MPPSAPVEPVTARVGRSAIHPSSQPPWVGAVPPLPYDRGHALHDLVPLRTFATVAAATLCLALLGACGSEDGDDTATDPAPAASSEATSESASAETTAAAATCEYADDGMPPAKPVDAPSDKPTDTGEVTL